MDILRFDLAITSLCTSLISCGSPMFVTSAKSAKLNVYLPPDVRPN